MPRTASEALANYEKGEPHFKGPPFFCSRLSVLLVVHDNAVGDIDHVVELCCFGGRKVDASVAAHAQVGIGIGEA